MHVIFYRKKNVFVSQMSKAKFYFSFAMTRKRTFGGTKKERFRKSDEQSKVYFSFAMTRKRTF